MSLSTYTCAYNGCYNSRATQHSLYRFPVRHINRCIEWMTNCGNEKLRQFLSNLHALKRHVVCEEHFLKRDFSTTGGLVKRLKSTAVPVPFVNGNTKLAELSAEQLNGQKVPCSDHSQDRDYANPLGQSDDGDDSRLSPVEFNIRIPVRTYKPVFSQPSTKATAPPANPKTSPLSSVSLQHLKRYRRKVVILESRIRKKDGLLRRHHGMMRRQHETIFRLREELGKVSQYCTTAIWKTSNRDLALRIYYKSPRIYRYLKDLFVITDLTRKNKSV